MDKLTIGIIGGGQLCQMMGEAIYNKHLPYRLIALDPAENCPASPYLHKQLKGHFKDEKQIKKLASLSDIIGFEIELANSRVLSELSIRGRPIHPSPETLRLLQDKYIQAVFLKEHDLPVPGFRAIIDENDIGNAIAEFGLPLMLKARTGSYDGKGNYVLRKKEDIAEARDWFGDKKLMAQQFIPFDTEISVIAARGTDGEIGTFPVGENIHGKNYNILETTMVPARVDKKVLDQAKKIAERTLDALKGAGVFGIEMFVHGQEVIINEIAPRVHNSGHYTIEGCHTSQFEQHIRAITGEKLGDTELVAGPVVMHNIIGPAKAFGNYTITYNSFPVNGNTCVAEKAVIHHYQKETVKPFRKMGHLTVVGKQGETLEEVIRRAAKIKNNIQIINQSIRYENTKTIDRNTDRQRLRYA